MPQVICKLSLVLHFLIWATEGPRKNRPLIAVLFWQISATICVCLLIAFFLSSFDHRTFGEVATVVSALYVVSLSWNLNQKGLIYYYVYANTANRIVWSFVWRKFSSVGIGEWWDEMKNGQKLKLGDSHVTPTNIQEVQAWKLGDAPEAPLLHRQKSGHLSTHYIFIASYPMRFSWCISTFAFSFVLFCLLQ
jgi:phage tail protein X